MVQPAEIIGCTAIPTILVPKQNPNLITWKCGNKKKKKWIGE
jgi:hypothetical protein